MYQPDSYAVSLTFMIAMISAAWEVSSGMNFRAAFARAKAFFAWMFALFLCGLGTNAVVPIF